MEKDEWKSYLSFTRKERNAIFVLLALIVIVAVLPWFFSTSSNNIKIDDVTERQLAELETDSTAEAPTPGTDTSSKNVNTASQDENLVLFYFDPNKLDEAGWRKLGLKDKTIRTIFNYRNKGGKFYHPQDIEKIYGLDKIKAAQLIPYIRIEKAENKSTDKPVIVKTPVTKPAAIVKQVHINTANEEDWKAFPGIGDVLSKRIIKFRTAVHGFKSIEDVGKTYGLSDSVFQSIKPYLIMD